MGRTKCYERENILQQATDLFWAKGFADTSLKQLEEKTGVNKSGLYAEFSGKEDLFLECLKHYTCNTEVYDILEKQPYGIKNIEQFLLKTVDEQKPGCFLVNTLRDWNLLPAKSKKFISQHIEKIKISVSKNCSEFSSPESWTEMIMTFNSGLAISMNALSADEGKKRVQTFLLFLKKNRASN